MPTAIVRMRILFGVCLHSHEQSIVSLTSFGEFLCHRGVPRRDIYLYFIVIGICVLLPFISFLCASLKCYPRLQFTVQNCQPQLLIFFPFLLLIGLPYSVEYIHVPGSNFLVCLLLVCGLQSLTALRGRGFASPHYLARFSVTSLLLSEWFTLFWAIALKFGGVFLPNFANCYHCINTELLTRANTVLGLVKIYAINCGTLNL